MAPERGGAPACRGSAERRANQGLHTPGPGQRGASLRAFIKSVALGRRHWLFAGSDSGERTAAIVFSVTMKCGQLGFDTLEYLRDVLDRVGNHPARPVEESLPNRWKKICLDADRR